MKKIFLTSKAKQDLKYIRNYYQQFSKELSDKLINKLLIKIENIGQFPEKYPKRYDLTQKDYRFYNFKDCSLYVIYKIDEDSIKIIRIVSSKKDITNKI